MGTDKADGHGREPRAGRLSHAEFAALANASDDAILRDCRVQVFRATGPGGQGVNTTDSAVRMRHLPSGIVVTSRESRSQYQNRQTCVAKLRREFAKRARRPRKRKKTKPSAAAKRRRLADKRHRARQKADRRRPSWDE